MASERILKKDTLKALCATFALSCGRTFIDGASILDVRNLAMLPIFLYSKKIESFGEVNTLERAVAVTVAAAGISYVLLDMKAALLVGQYAGAALASYYGAAVMLDNYMGTSSLEKLK